AMRAQLGSVQHLMQAAIQEINGYYAWAELVGVNVGWRPTTQDTYPLLGQTSIANLYIAGGTKRDGFHLSPVISEIMAAQMTGKTIDSRFNMFAPERPLIRDIGRDQGIEIGVR